MDYWTLPQNGFRFAVMTRILGNISASG